MASIIDALVVTLTLDAASFQRQLSSVEKRLTDAQKSLRKTGEAGEAMGLGTIKGATGASLALRGLAAGFAALPLAAVAAAAGVAAAFLKVSAAVRAADREILTLSRTTDIAPARMNAIGAVAERYNGSREGAEMAAAKLTGQLQRIRMGTGDEDFINNASWFGVSTRGSGAAGVATTDEFRQRLIADMHRRAQRGTAGILEAQQEGEKFGLDVGTIQAAVASNNYEEELRQQAELARVTPGGLKASEGFGQSLSDLKNAWDGVIREMIEPIEAKLTPFVIKLTGYVKDLGDWFQKIDWDKLQTFFNVHFKSFTDAMQTIGTYEWSRLTDAFRKIFEWIDNVLGTDFSGHSPANRPDNDPTSTKGETDAWIKGAFNWDWKPTPGDAGQLAEPIRQAMNARGITNPDSQNALLGALFSESGLQPGIKEDGGRGPGEGLPQWTTQERKDRITEHLKKPILSASSAEQTAAIMWEMQNFYPQVWAILNDPNASRDDKVRAITRTYLAPRDTAGRVVADQKRARDFEDRPYRAPGTLGGPKIAPEQGPPVQQTPQNTDPSRRLHTMPLILGSTEGPPERSDPESRFNVPMLVTQYNERAEASRQYAMASIGGGGVTAGASNTTNVTINGMEIHSAATDADGIARDMHGALRSQFGNPTHLALAANGAVA